MPANGQIIRGVATGAEALTTSRKCVGLDGEANRLEAGRGVTPGVKMFDGAGVKTSPYARLVGSDYAQSLAVHVLPL